jgi:hypothetical protein
MEWSLYVDDLRDIPTDSEGQWVCARNYKDAIQLLNSDMEFHEVSLDHDLGTKKDGNDIVLWMVEHNVWPDIVTVHTQNVVAADEMMSNLCRYAPETTVVRLAR